MVRVLKNPIDKTLPISLKIAGNDFIHFESITVSRSIDSFVDTFNISINNPGGMYSRKISVGSNVDMYSQGVLFFRGVIEVKRTTIVDARRVLVISGREELLKITEDDADPRLGPFKNKTDNDIIKTLLGSYGFSLELGAANVIKEYAISGNTKVGQVIDDVVKQNDYFFFKRGKTCYKKQIPKTGLAGKNKFVVGERDGNIYIGSKRVLALELLEDITACKSQIKGFGYQGGRKKIGVSYESINTYLTDGSYARRLRNSGKLSGIPINRKAYITGNAKDKTELIKQVRRTLINNDIKNEVTLTVYEYFDINLLDAVKIAVPSEDINQTMYIKSHVYTVNSQNTRTTQIILAPFNTL